MINGLIKVGLVLSGITGIILVFIGTFGESYTPAIIGLCVLLFGFALLGVRYLLNKKRKKK